MMRRGLKNLYEESGIPEFGTLFRFCEIGMVLWAVIQYMVIINLFKGIQVYIGEKPYDKYLKFMISAISAVAVCGCLVMIPVASTVRMAGEIAMTLWSINLLNKTQMQIMKR